MLLTGTNLRRSINMLKIDESGINNSEEHGAGTVLSSVTMLSQIVINILSPGAS